MRKLILRRLAAIILGSSILITNTPAFAQSFKGTPLITKGTVKIEFTSFTKAGYPEQDVFVSGKSVAFPNVLNDQIYRLSGVDAIDPVQRAKGAFASRTTLSHDIFRETEKPLGLFTRGADLNTTISGWLRAEGFGTYTVNSNQTALQFTFQHLMPNALYSIWCSRVVLPPNASWIDLPCGASDGSQNSFRTNASGDANFMLTIPAMLPSSAKEKSAFTLVYHSDGLTHGNLPGEFGYNAHVQLFAFLPTKAEHETRIASDLTQERAACVATAIGARDFAIEPLIDDYYAAVKNAFAMRRDTLRAAWLKPTDKERKAAIKIAVADYTVAIQKAWKDLRTGREKAWKQFRLDRKVCAYPEDSEDKKINEAFDAKL